MMSLSLAESLSPHNAITLDRMTKTIDLAEGFTLFFARCDASSLCSRLMLAASQTLAGLGIEAVEVAFQEEPKDIRRRLRSALAAEKDETDPDLISPAPVLGEADKRVVFVTGLEIGIPDGQPNTRTLAELNLGRDRFPIDVPHPLVIWLPDYALTAVARFAPDFWSWRSGVYEYETGGVSAVAEMKAVVALEEATGHPDLADDRAELERLRARQ